MDSIISAMDTKTWIDSIFKVVVAIWAFFLLFYLRQRDRVNAEITKINTDAAKNRRDMSSKELADREIELRIRRQIIVAIEIEVDEDKICVERPIFVLIRMKNHGNEATIIKWEKEEPPFTVRFVSFDQDGKPEYGAPRSFQVGITKNPAQPARSHVVRPQSAETLTFAFQPDKEGVYLLSFRAPTAEDVRNEVKKLGVELPTVWTANRYVYVPKSNIV